MSRAKFNKNHPDEICGADLMYSGTEAACLRRYGHDGDHVALARDAEFADGVCFYCRLKDACASDCVRNEDALDDVDALPRPRRFKRRVKA